MLNQMEFILDMEVKASFVTYVFLFPISKQINQVMAYRCEEGTDGRPVCGFDGARDERGSGKTNSSSFQIALSRVQFEDTTTPLTDLNVSTTANVSIDTTLPALVTRVADIPNIDLYVSEDKISPTLKSIKQHHLPGIGSASVKGFDSGRAFQASLNSHVEGKRVAQVEKLQMAASRYLGKDDSKEPFYVYVVSCNDEPGTYLAGLFQQIGVLRIEMLPLDASSNVDDNNSASITNVLIKSLYSDVENAISLSSGVQVAFPFVLDGVFPALQLGVSNGDGVELVDLSIQGRSMNFTINASMPDVFHNARVLQQSSIVSVHGSEDKGVSLLSLILGNISFPIVDTKDGTSSRAVAYLNVSSTTTQVASVLRLQLLNLSLPAPIQLSDAWLDPLNDFEIFVNKTERVVLNISQWTVGARESEIAVKLVWGATDGGDRMQQLIDGYINQKKTVLVHMLKKGCVDATLLPPPTSSSSSSSSDLNATMQVLSVSTTQNEGPLDVMCALGKFDCDVGGPGLEVLAKVNISQATVHVEAFPSLHFDFGPNTPTIRFELSRTLLEKDIRATLQSASAHDIHSIMVLQDPLSRFKGKDNLLSEFVGRLVSRTQLSQAANTTVLDIFTVEIINGKERAGLNVTARSSTQITSEVIILPALDTAVFSSNKKVLGKVLGTKLVLSGQGLPVGNATVAFTTEKTHEKAMRKCIKEFADTSSTVISLQQDKGISIDLNLNITMAPSTSSSSSNITIDLLGGFDPSSGKRVYDMNIPCVVPELCGVGGVMTSKTPYTKYYDTLVTLWSLRDVFPRAKTVRIQAPELSFMVMCYIHSKLLSVRVAPLNLSIGDKESFKIPMVHHLEDLDLLKKVIKVVRDSVYSVGFNVFMSERDGDLLSSLFADAKYEYMKQAESPDGKPIPTPKSQQWWFPLSSVGSWTLQGTETSKIVFDVKMLLNNPSPVNINVPPLLGTVSLDSSFGPMEFGTFSTNGSFELKANTLGSKLINVEAVGMEEPHPGCSIASRSVPSTKGNCVISTLLEMIISQIETRVLVAGSFVNAVGEKVSLGMHVLFLEGLRGGPVVSYIPPPRYTKDLPDPASTSAIDEFISVFQTITVDKFNSAWKTLLEDGVTVDIHLKLYNPFVFPVTLETYKVNVIYDDPFGEYLWYLPASYEPKYGNPLVTELVATGLELELEPGVSKLTPANSVRLLEKKEEHACRLYNAAEKLGQLCGALPDGIVELRLGNFSWTQHFSLYNITLVGDNACLASPLCTPNVGTPRGVSSWDAVGSATIVNNNELVLTKGERDEIGATWAHEKQSVHAGFVATFNFTLQDTATMGGGDGFAFVVQREAGPHAIGERCKSTPCNGYKGIEGKSVGIILFRSLTKHIELHILIDGNTELDIGFGNSPVLSEVADGKQHSMKVYYSRADRKLYVYIDGHVQVAANVWEPANIDTGICSYGSQTPAYTSCIDMDGIADQTGGSWVGFTASTGFGYTSKQTITDFSFSPIQPSLHKTKLVESGLFVGTVGKPTFITLDTRDSCGAPVTKKVDAVVQLVHLENPTIIVETKIRDVNNDGVMIAQFTPPSHGSYAVNLRFSPQPQFEQIANISIW
mmetsp:Transcript_21376/g.46606  ORF Transcript_21376/g.46606 Transcript_21376/m.46606 type:complete len:1596 (+) Transcript_21376:1032-5819(+)